MGLMKQSMKTTAQTAATTKMRIFHVPVSTRFVVCLNTAMATDIASPQTMPPKMTRKPGFPHAALA